MRDQETGSSEKELRISQYFSYVGPFIIFLGMTRLMAFYSSFGVSIISYLDFSEVITSFFDILFIVITFLAYGSIQNFLIRNKNLEDEADKKRQEILNEGDLWKLCQLYFKFFKPLLIYILIVITCFIIALLVFNWITTWTLLITLIIFIFLVIFLIIGVEIERKHVHFKSTINRQRFIFLTLYFLVFTLGVTFYSSYQARLIKNDKSTYGIAVLLDNEQKFVSDSSDYFIGKTQNYLFIYHEKQSTTDIIPMTRVKQIIMVDKKLVKRWWNK
jgi:hypothetical protein